MKKTLSFIFVSFCAILLFSLSAAAQNQKKYLIAPNLTNKDREPHKNFPVIVEYPHQNTRLDADTKGTFIFGRVAPNGGLLTINGVRVPLYRTGAFLAYLPVKPGKFDFLLDFTDNQTTYRYKRTVIVDGFSNQGYGGKYLFDNNFIFPDQNLELTTADDVVFTAAGSPGRKVLLTLTPDFKDIPMKENPENPGEYSVKVPFTDRKHIKKPVRAYYVMYDDKGREKVRVSSRGKVKVLPYGELVETAKVKTEDVRLRPEPKGKKHILDTKLYGKVNITGEKNGFYRVELDENNSGWLEKYHAEKSQYLEPPKNIVWEVDLSSRADITRLVIKNTEKVSFKADNTPGSFDITLFNTQALNTVMTEPNSAFVQNINYQSLSDTTKKISLLFRKGQVMWGYLYTYQDNNLIFEIYHKPNFFFTDKLPLRNLKIVLDPGHSPKRTVPYDGAVGPSGMLEYEVNYRIAQTTKKLLEKYGAKVFMSKEEKEILPLNRRTDKISTEQAHLFISVHNNALPDNVNPFEKDRGFSVYYYYPHSLPFALAMERSFIKNIGLPSEGVVNTDFSVTRNLPQVPSILVENAYMIIPYQEDLLKQQRFIDMLANAIVQGVINFVNPTWQNPKDKKPDMLML